MTKLVFIENGRPVTDSLTVAATFGKRHADVMRDIRSLDSSEEFNQRNFAQVNYVDGANRKYPKYLITQDGFSFLVMGYTGKEAAHFKEMYINEFNRMREELSKPTDLEKFLLNPDTIIKIAENWKTEQKLRLAAEKKIEENKPKVIFAEALEVSNSTILIGELAKLLKQNGIEIGQNRLFERLRKEGYLGNKGEYYNIPTQRSMELGLFEIKTRSINNPDGSIRVTKTTKVTGKGQIYFINKFKIFINV